MRLDSLERRLAVAALLAGLAAAALLWRGDRVLPRVETFNLEERTVQPERLQLLFIFNRDMDRASVQDGFHIAPALPGKFSWIGRRMAYTPSAPPEYGQRLSVTLAGARDASGRAMAQAYTARFRTPELRIAYIGVDGDEAGRLVTLHPGSGSRDTLTGTGLRVYSFRADPDGQHVLFMATEQATTPPGRDPTAYQQLYRVDEANHATELLADSKGFINYDFNVSPDGATLVLTRDHFGAGPLIPKGLWLRSTAGGAWRALDRPNLVGYPAWISPDGVRLLAIDAGTGFVLAPLASPKAPAQFLGAFAETYGFSPSGNRIAFLAGQDGADGRREEYLAVLDRAGKLTEIARGLGVATDPRFSADDRFLYFLMSRTRVAAARRHDFHAFRHAFQDGRVTALTTDARYQENSLDLSADGRRLVFERDAVKELEARDDRDAADGLSRPAGHRPELWMCQADGTACRSLGVRGLNPQWLR